MTLQNNIFGQTYDDSEPCFLTTEQGVRVWSCVDNRWFNWLSLVKLAETKTHNWANREVGIPSLTWQEHNSRISGQQWAPGLDDTAGLTTEAVVNGEDWTAAAGATPPTGWAVDGDVDFSLNGGWLTITATDEVTFAQTLTTVEGTYYVLEAAIGGLTTGDVTVEVNGVTVPVGEGGDAAFNSVSKCASFPALGATTDVTFTIPAGGVLELKYVRCYEEAELTGAGPGQASIPPTPPETEVAGPFTTGDTTYFVQSFPASGAECLVWFDVDSDPDPDIKLTLQAVCESNVNDEAKMHIHATLQAMNYCTGLPCMTTRGRLQKPYRKGPE